MPLLAAVQASNVTCGILPSDKPVRNILIIMSRSSRPDRSGERVFSFYEFWPTWVMYAPVVVLWLWQSLKSLSFTVPLLANPRIPLGGMVGAPKSAILGQVQGQDLQDAVLPWCVYHRTEGRAGEQVKPVLALMAEHGLHLPVVFKPDCGCRGAGVRKISSEGEILSYMLRFPPGADLFIQQLASHPHEAGIFYVREPGDNRGRVVSVTLKHMPSVTGDGQSTLEALVAADPRTGRMQALYRDRLRHRWQDVVPAGEEVPLLFSASHCRGAVFRDARHLIMPELEVAIDKLMQQLPDFHYGRLDVKFADTQALREGRDLEIIEINGASAELIHIWDSRTPFGEAIRSLLWQYRTLFEIGRFQRRKGHRPPGLLKLLRGWHREKSVTRHFPVTD